MINIPIILNNILIILINILITQTPITITSQPTPTTQQIIILSTTTILRTLTSQTRSTHSRQNHATTNRQIQQNPHSTTCHLSPRRPSLRIQSQQSSTNTLTLPNQTRQINRKQTAHSQKLQNEGILQNS